MLAGLPHARLVSPAHAGVEGGSALVRWLVVRQPRACGGRGAFRDVTAPMMPSAPRMRG